MSSLDEAAKAGEMLATLALIYDAGIVLTDSQIIELQEFYTFMHAFHLKYGDKMLSQYFASILLKLEKEKTNDSE